MDQNTAIRLIFGFKLRCLRLEQKKSYAELAKQTGLSTSYLNDIEKGKKYPKPDKAALLAKSFGISYDEMVSTRSDRRFQPIVDLISSDFFKVFPSEQFGLSMEKVLDIFTTAPNKTNAFISTIIKIIRSYQIGQEDFYRVALRSYQDIHNNYFPEIEAESKELRKELEITKPTLEGILTKNGYVLNYDTLSGHTVLKEVRSYFDPVKKMLYVNKELSEAQQLFVLAKEVGFVLLNLSERPLEIRLNREASFEKLLSNFKASYFAISLLIPEESILADIKELTRFAEWNPGFFHKLLEKYQVTPEMLLQRFTNILPAHFGINDLFFIKINEKSDGQFDMTKELHMSQLHNPYSNQLREHLCHRWVSITSIQQLKSDVFIDAQISDYLDHDNRYFCISIAQASNFSESRASSVTIGMLVTPELRANFNLLRDENFKQRTVHTTCERCPLMDCRERAAEPVFVKATDKEVQISEALNDL